MYHDQLVFVEKRHVERTILKFFFINLVFHLIVILIALGREGCQSVVAVVVDDWVSEYVCVCVCVCVCERERERACV